MPFRDLELELLWGAWAELGVSGWGRTHRHWAVDPEPLIIRTAELEDEDPRLRDESLDWCIQYSRYVSKVRLRALLRNGGDRTTHAWGRYAATVNEHSSARWPSASEAINYKATGRSSLKTMKEPSRVWLRMRAMFGVSARTEILRYFLSGRATGSTTRITNWVGYAKSNVVSECDSLEKAGVLRRRRLGNRYTYSLADRDTLQGFVGEIARFTPSWTALLGATAAFVELESLSTLLPEPVLNVEAHRTSRALEDLLDELGIEDRPQLVEPAEQWREMRDFAYGLLSAWASGVWDPADIPRSPEDRP